MSTSANDSPQRVEISCKLDERKGRLHITINEDVTSTSVANLRSAFLEFLEKHGSANWKSLYLDIRSARMVDSMGMNWIFAETLRLKENHREMVVRISSPAIHRVMQFAGMDRIATVKFRRRKQTR